MARATFCIVKQNGVNIKLVCFALPHPEVSESQINQTDEIYHGKDNGAAGRRFPDKFIQQQPTRADDNEDKAAYFNEVSHQR